MSADALSLVIDDEPSGPQGDRDATDLPDLRPAYDLQGDSRLCRWFGGIVVDFASKGEVPPDLHPSMTTRIDRSLTGRHPRYIYDKGTMYLTFRLLSLSEQRVVGDFADSLERWLGRTVAHRVFEHGPPEVVDGFPEGNVVRIH